MAKVVQCVPWKKEKKKEYMIQITKKYEDMK
jgi:hypothetical protein